MMSAVLATTALVACTNGQPLPGDAPVQATRAFADLFQDKPFDEAAVKIVAAQGGELQTYTLRPCNSGTGVCGATTGAYERTADYYVVSGAYPGRTFWLSPGGDGYTTRAGVTSTLAWHEATQ